MHNRKVLSCYYLNYKRDLMEPGPRLATRDRDDEASLQILGRGPPAPYNGSSSGIAVASATLANRADSYGDAVPKFISNRSPSIRGACMVKVREISGRLARYHLLSDTDQ